MELKEYSGYETRKNGTLLEKLESLNEDNTLFVSDYYFVLQTKDNFFFYLNPCFFLGQVKTSELSNFVIDFLESSCGKFFNILKTETEQYSKKDWVTSNLSFPETPELGNHYSSLGNRIITEKGKFHFFMNYSGNRMCDITKISATEVMEMLYFAVTTKSPNRVKILSDLNCFKQ